MIHPNAVIGDDVQIPTNAQVGPFVVVGLDGAGSPPVLGEQAVLRSHSVVYRGSRIGARLHLGHGALVREECEFGDDVSVGSHSVVEHHVRLGHGVRLHSGCFVPEESVIEDGAWLGPGVIVTNARYPNREDTKASLDGVHIGIGAVVGAGVVLLPGVSLGAGCLVGAGAVVVDDVEPGTTIVGNPGRLVS